MGKKLWVMFVTVLAMTLALSIGAFAADDLGKKYDLEKICNQIVAGCNSLDDYEEGSTQWFSAADLNIDAEDWAEVRDYFTANRMEAALFQISSWNISGDKIANYRISFRFSKADMVEAMAAMQTELDIFMMDVDPNWSDYEKVLYIHEYLTYSCDYISNPDQLTLYGALVKRQLVCQGYATSFYFLANRLGMKDTVFVGSSKLNHTWNAVKIDGEYYYIDTTWDDPVGNLPSKSGNAYFLKSYQYFYEHGHATDDWYFSDPNFVKTSCKSTKYDDSGEQLKTGSSRWIFRNGKWYSLMSDSSKVHLTEFIYKNGKMVENKVLFSWPGKWQLVGQSWFYVGNFSGFCSLNDKLYFNGPAEVYAYDFSSGKTEKVYSLSEEQSRKYFIFDVYDRDGEVFALQNTMITDPNRQDVSIGIKCTHKDPHHTGQCEWCHKKLDGTTQFLGTSAWINDAFQLTFYLRFAPEYKKQASKDAYILISQHEGNSSKIVKSEKIPLDRSQDFQSYTVSYKVNAKEMMDDLHVCLCDGSKKYTVYVWSVEYYLRSLVASDNRQSIKDFAIKALNYGANAQICFNYNTSNLANKNMGVFKGDRSTVQKNVASSVDIQEVEKKYTGKQIEYVGTTLLLKDQTMVRHYFKLSGNWTSAEIAQANLTKKDNLYYWQSEKIAPTQYGQAFTTSVLGMKVTYSVNTYMNKALKSNDENLKNLCVSMYYFSESAKKL